MWSRCSRDLLGVEQDPYAAVRHLLTQHMSQWPRRDLAKRAGKGPWPDIAAILEMGLVVIAIRASVVTVVNFS